MANGEFRSDIEITLNLLFAPVYYRLLLGHEPITDSFAAVAVEHLVAGLRH